MTPVVENTNYGTGEEKAEKVVETAMITPGATAWKAMDDIRGMLHKMGVEDVPDAETSKKITLKEPATLRELAQQRIFQLYSLGNEDESRRFGPMRTLQAETFANHLSRINNKGVEHILPAGAEIVIDDEVVAPGHAHEVWEPAAGQFSFKELDQNDKTDRQE